MNSILLKLYEAMKTYPRWAPNVVFLGEERVGGR